MNGLLTIAAALLTYATPYAFPDPALAFYVMRGVFGCGAAIALATGWRISWPSAGVVIILEGSTSICGLIFEPQSGPITRGMCDAGSGMPLSLPVLAVVVLATLRELYLLGDKKP